MDDFFEFLGFQKIVSDTDKQKSTYKTESYTTVEQSECGDKLNNYTTEDEQSQHTR